MTPDILTAPSHPEPHSHTWTRLEREAIEEYGRRAFAAGAAVWRPIETAPASGLVQLAVEDAAGERRTFAAEASHGEGGCVWMITVGWGGWTRLHRAWTPISWQPLSQAPNGGPPTEPDGAPK